MPIELVGDQKEIRVWQYHQLRDYVLGLAKDAAAKRPAFAIENKEQLSAWQRENRPLIERALGWPAPIPEYEPQLISEEEIGSDELVRSIRRMTIRVAEGLDVYGILLLPYKENPKLMLCFHGGIGCPELVTSVCDSSNYNDGARKFVELGFAVFAPLFVLRREEEIESDWPAEYRMGLHMNALWAGTTVLAIELAKAERALKFFDTYPGVDASEAGVAGLSYGGYFALYAAALIPRITFSVSSCYFNDRLDFMVKKHASLLDWQYPGAGALFTDVEIAALICPKPLYIEAGQRDELMDVEGAKREAEKVRAMYAACGAEKEFFFDPFDGTHEFNLSHIGKFFKDRMGETPDEDDIRRFARENTVSSEKQVCDVVVRSAEEGCPKILFVGNSITLHGVNHSIGWHGLWGMSASTREKDYVHQTMRMAREIRPEAGFMIAQAADWERGFWLNEESLENVKAAREYDADIVVFRLGENVRDEDVKNHDLLAAYEKMMDFFNPSGKAKLIVTNLFWPVPEKDAIVEQAAKNKGAAFVRVNHLGTQDEMKAIGLFDHPGVAVHPGDLGMLKIAEAIFEAMKPML